ncbi:MAG: pilus assembly PilX N-terminal domain-containing protein [Candidatus Pacebacteria bacterium]|nr:pilus assembly PilX N-terminal domain-containing protein [Candidatus Paceibacterota bacterium]
MKKFFIQKNKGLPTIPAHAGQTGFAMLFTVLIVTLILSIAIGISNTTLKQTILSGLAKDSQVAFYEADTAIECGMYYDSLDTFPVGTGPGDVKGSIYCGNKEFIIDISSYTDYLIFSETPVPTSAPCSTIIFDKTYASGADINVVKGFGYNLCSTNTRQVERALEVRYDATI